MRFHRNLPWVEFFGVDGGWPMASRSPGAACLPCPGSCMERQEALIILGTVARAGTWPNVEDIEAVEIDGCGAGEEGKAIRRAESAGVQSRVSRVLRFVERWTHEPAGRGASMIASGETGKGLGRVASPFLTVYPCSRFPLRAPSPSHVGLIWSRNGTVTCHTQGLIDPDAVESCSVLWQFGNISETWSSAAKVCFRGSFCLM